MHIVKLENCTLCIICISFSFVHAPVCANCKSDSCNCILFKKKKKKKRKMTRTLVWVKIPKLCHKKNPAIYLFLGKGRESLHLQLYLKKLSLVHFLPCPPARKTFFNSDTVWMTHAKILAKIDQKSIFLANFTPFQ